jgi:hypothetical protein
MSADDGPSAVALRLGLAVLVAAVVVVAAWTVPAFTAPGPAAEGLSTPEYAPDNVSTTAAPAAGEVESDPSVGAPGGVVVIDDDHANRFDQATIDPLVTELVETGYTVRIHDGERELEEVLAGAEAYVVVDPGGTHAPDEVATIREFTDAGGHLLLVGEPTRRTISTSFTGASISDQESRLTPLTTEYGMLLGSPYLYNTGTNVGNYKNVVVRPTTESGLTFDRAALFTAAAVRSDGGTVLLRAAPGTVESGQDSQGRHPVAVRKSSEGVLLVGDKSFLATGHYNVADNEQFLAALVEFLKRGEAPPASFGEDDTTEDDGTPDGDDTPTPDGDDTPTPDGDGTATPDGDDTPTPENVPPPALAT